jgi:hypothetical protein
MIFKIKKNAIFFINIAFIFIKLNTSNFKLLINFI